MTIDPGSPAVALRSGLRRVCGVLDELDLRDVVEAASGFVEAVRTNTVAHVPSPVLDDAVTGARRRPTGDGSWVLDRRRSMTDVSPLIAATLARYRHPSVSGAMPGAG